LFLAIGATSVWVLPTLRSAVEQGNVQAADGSVATIAAVKSNEIRTTVPTNPFECAHSRSFHYDKTGRRLICVTQRGELLVWNDNGESPAVTLLEKKPGGRVFDRAPMSAVVVARGTDVVLFYLDGRVQVWSVDTRRRVKDLESDRKDFGYAHSSPDGGLVACLSYARQGNSSAILFWNTRDWTTAGRIESAERISDFCFTPDGRQVLACVGHPTDQKHLGFTGIVTWNLATKQEAGRIEYGTGFPIRIAVSPDARWVATGGGDAVPVAENARSLSGHLRVFDWVGKKFVTEPYTLATDYVRAVQFSPDSKLLYSGSYSDPPGGGQYIAGVRAYRVGDWVSQWNTTLGNGNPHELCVSPNGKDILVPDSGNLQIIDAKDGTVRGKKLTFRFYPEDGDGEILK
jgi:WD40 repeat protein